MTALTSTAITLMISKFLNELRCRFVNINIESSTRYHCYHVRCTWQRNIIDSILINHIEMEAYPMFLVYLLIRSINIGKWNIFINKDVYFFRFLHCQRRISRFSNEISSKKYFYFVRFDNGY